MVEVLSVTSTEASEDICTTSIAVAGEQNFLVGSMQILAHNQHSEIISVSSVLCHLSQVAHCARNLAYVTQMPKALAIAGTVAVGYGSYRAYHYLKNMFRQRELHHAMKSCDIDSEMKKVANHFRDQAPVEFVTTKPPSELDFEREMKSLRQQKEAIVVLSRNHNCSFSMAQNTAYADTKSVRINACPIPGGASLSCSWSSDLGFPGSVSLDISRTTYNIQYELSPYQIACFKEFWSHKYGLPFVEDNGFCMVWKDWGGVEVRFSDNRHRLYKKTPEAWTVIDAAYCPYVLFSLSNNPVEATWFYSEAVYLTREADCLIKEDVIGKHWIVVSHKDRTETHFLSNNGKVITRYGNNPWNQSFQILLREGDVWTNLNGDRYSLAIDRPFGPTGRLNKYIFVHDRSGRLIAKYLESGQLYWSLAEEEA